MFGCKEVRILGDTTILNGVQLRPNILFSLTSLSLVMKLIVVNL